MTIRPDRRKDSKESRPFSAEQNVLSRADGSARFELGTTAVICSVNGPMEVQLRDEKLDEATIEIVCRPAKGNPCTKERLLEHTLRTTFAPIVLGGMMPRTLIQITTQILKDDGSALAASINAISLALMDAGVPLKYLAAAATCMIDKETQQVVLDPTTVELQNAKSVHTFAFDNSRKTPFVLLSDSDGVFNEEEYKTCYKVCLEAVEQTHAFLRTAVESKKRKEHQQ
ncbi:ribosomal protein S5 domain 2-type protein [Sporodiniella umbellata]|nr:ribosomal protein S5 domain 2-type protein [Sporodiniella umbellata]